MKGTISLVALMSLAGLALATDEGWVRYARSKDGVVYHYRADRIDTDRFTGYKRVWVMGESPKPRPVFINKKTPLFTTSKAQYSIDCSNRSMAEGAASFYGKQGDLVHSSTGSALQEPVAPDTIGDALLEQVCAPN